MDQDLIAIALRLLDTAHATAKDESSDVVASLVKEAIALIKIAAREEAR